MVNISRTFLLSTIVLSVTSFNIDSDGYEFFESFMTSYKFYKGLYNFEDGLSKCLSERALLFYPETIEEARIIYDKIVTHNVTRFLVGIHNYSDDKKYVAIDGNDVFIKTWDRGNPKIGDFHAVLYSNMTLQSKRNTYYNSIVCMKRKRTLVYDKPFGKKISLFYDNYKFINRTLNPLELLLQCLQERTEVFHPVSHIESVLVMVIIVPNNVDRIYVGIQNGKRKEYATLDGRTDFFANWHEGEPIFNSSRVVTLNRVGSKFSTNETKRQYGVCVKRTTWHCEGSNYTYSKYSGDTNMIYTFHDECVTWKLAVSRCNESNSSLAMPFDPQGLLFVKNNLHWLQNTGIWMGFHNIFGEIDYVNLTDYPLKFETRDVENLNVGGCGLLDPKGNLTVKDCNTKLPYVCERLSTTEDFVYMPESDKSYGFSSFALSWFDARRTCKNLGASLAMPTNTTEAQILKDAMKTHGKRSIFVGFHNYFSCDFSTLTDMIRFPHDLLSSHEQMDSRKRCGSLADNGLQREECEVKQHFFCEKQYSADDEQNKIWNFTNKLSKGLNLMHIHYFEVYNNTKIHEI